MRLAALLLASLLLATLPTASATPFEFEDCGNGLKSVKVYDTQVVHCWYSDPIVEVQPCLPVGFRVVVLGQPGPCIPIY